MSPAIIAQEKFSGVTAATEYMHLTSLKLAVGIKYPNQIKVPFIVGLYGVFFFSGYESLQVMNEKNLISESPAKIIFL